MTTKDFNPNAFGSGVSDAAPPVDPFESASFYSCKEDNETLSYESPEEAIMYYAESFLTPGCDTEKVIRTEVGGVDCYAYSRKRVLDTWARGMAERMLEDLTETFVDDYSGPDGEDNIDEENFEDLFERLASVAADFVAQQTVWQCEQVAERTYSVEEVIAMMRQECPEWFETEEAPS